MNDWEPPVYDVACTLCVRRIRHDHPNGLRPVWPCLFCHDGYHIRCDVYAWCSCDCGIEEIR